MSNLQNAEVLVREGIQQGASAVAPVTYPIGAASDSHKADMLARIATMETELRAGNVESAIRIGHLVGGRAARLGEKRVAGLVRHAVVMSRFYVLNQAGDLVAQAHSELATAAR
jgi:hypothetical protein